MVDESVFQEYNKNESKSICGLSWCNLTRRQRPSLQWRSLYFIMNYLHNVS